MNLAIIILLVTSLPIIYYYWNLHEVNEKSKYTIGILAGVWAFFGLLLATWGIIGFSYYLILGLLIILVYFFEPMMSVLNIELEGVHDDYDEDDEEAGTGEYEVEWPVDVSNLMMGFVVLIVVALMYSAFLFTAVSPARAEDTAGFDEDEKTVKYFPNAIKYEYKSVSARGYVVIITVRSVPVTTGMLESALDTVKEDVEEYIWDNYKQDATLELKDEEATDIDGYDGYKQIYDVWWDTIIGGRKTAEMTLEAFFFNEDFEMIIIGFVYTPEGKAATQRLVDSITY